MPFSVITGCSTFLKIIQEISHYAFPNIKCGRDPPTLINVFLNHAFGDGGVGGAAAADHVKAAIPASFYGRDELMKRWAGVEFIGVCGIEHQYARKYRREGRFTVRHLLCFDRLDDWLGVSDIKAGLLVLQRIGLRGSREWRYIHGSFCHASPVVRSCCQPIVQLYYFCCLYCSLRFAEYQGRTAIVSLAGHFDVLRFTVQAL